MPAVVGDDGGLVNVTISLSPGYGRIFATISPRTGVMAQESVENAVIYGYRLAGPGRLCDVLVDFGNNPSTTYIDGPSAGAALTAMTYALLMNKTLRGDCIVTGTIEPDGQVGQVGGLYEKAKSAASVDAEYFITPVESIYEIMILRQMEEQYGIKVIQARSVEEVIGFMAENQSIPQENLEVPKRAVPDIPEYDSSEIESFRPIAMNMVDLERSLAEAINASGAESASARDFFSAEAARQEGIIGKGYLFSGANEAFLNFIDISTINAILSGKVDLARKKGEAGICLTGLRRPALTSRNFEWVVGADQRQGWAYQRLDDTDIDDRFLTDEKYAVYNEIMYAQAWCIVARELISGAPPGGDAINESAWEGLAKKRIEEASALNPADSDYLERLQIAQSNYDSGRYGAAIFDAVYVIENTEAAQNEADAEGLAALIGEERERLWGRIYQSHAAFLLAQNETAAAYRTARFAKGLDKATLEMEEAAVPVLGSGPADTAKNGQDGGVDSASELLFLAAAGISIFLFLILLFMIARRKHGADSTGPLKADRIKQKKG